MTTAGTHMIHRHTLELTGSHLQTIRSLEAEMHTWMSAQLNRTIESCFDDVAQNGRHIVIEKIEIDLGNFRSQDFIQRFDQRLGEKLTQHLRTYLKDTRAEQLPDLQHVSRESAHHDDGGLLHEMSIHESALRALEHYLVTGTLPWWWNVHEAPRKQWLQMHGGPEAIRILECMKHSRSAISRVVESVNDVMLEKIVSAAGRGNAIPSGWQAIRNSFSIVSTTREREDCRRSYWEFCLDYITGHRALNTLSIGQLTSSLQNVLPWTADELHFFFAMAFDVDHHPNGGRAKDNNPDNDAQLKDEVPSASANVQKGAHEGSALMKGFEENMRSDARNGTIQNISGVDDGQMTEAVFATPDSQRNDKKTHHSLKENALPVNTAGLVILHPFLPELFRSQGLLDGNDFKHTQARNRAVRMTGYLAYGDVNSAEYDLLLPKLFCGVSWADSLCAPVQWDESDADACDSLLTAVVAHWAVLGNTSPDGLREGFIRRSGILSAYGTSWRLSVEQKAQDVLLAKLPWGMHTIRLPWMEGTLHVSWI